MKRMGAVSFIITMQLAIFQLLWFARAPLCMSTKTCLLDLPNSGNHMNICHWITPTITWNARGLARCTTKDSSCNGFQVAFVLVRGLWGMFFPMCHGTFIVCFHIAQLIILSQHGANHIFHRYILGFFNETIWISGLQTQIPFFNIHNLGLQWSIWEIIRETEISWVTGGEDLENGGLVLTCAKIVWKGRY